MILRSVWVRNPPSCLFSFLRISETEVDEIIISENSEEMFDPADMEDIELLPNTESIELVVYDTWEEDLEILIELVMLVD